MWRVISLGGKRSLLLGIRSFGTHTRIVLISDTHNKHGDLGELPHGDILIHAGDFAESARPPRPEEYKSFIDWFASQPHAHKIFISGNRDIFMDAKNCLKYENSTGFWLQQVQNYVKGEKSLVYLEDSSYKIPLASGVAPLHVYGTPWTAVYGRPGKAFQVPLRELEPRWADIPEAVDILVTHMPPYDVCDMNAGGVRSGCRRLWSEVTERIRPRLHVFGHIHEGRGHKFIGATLFVNAASKRPRSTQMNRPFVVDFPLDRRQPLTVI